MRFYKVLSEIPLSPISRLKVGDIICFSNYYTSMAIVATASSCTKFPMLTTVSKMELLLDYPIRQLTERELNKIRPHLTKQMLKYDI